MIFNYNEYLVNENNNIIKYKDNGINEKCPVCENEIIYENYSDVESVNCDICDFDFNIEFDYSFNGSEHYNPAPQSFNKGDVILGTNKKYLSDGDDTCPFCESQNMTLLHHRVTDDEEEYDYHCDTCGEEWTKYMRNKAIIAYDINDNIIKTNDIVDLSLFNKEKYLEYQKNKKINDFNI